MNNDKYYEDKYLKYKTKYLEQTGGILHEDIGHSKDLVVRMKFDGITNTNKKTIDKVEYFKEKLYVIEDKINTDSLELQEKHKKLILTIISEVKTTFLPEVYKLLETLKILRKELQTKEDKTSTYNKISKVKTLGMIEFDKMNTHILALINTGIFTDSDVDELKSAIFRNFQEVRVVNLLDVFHSIEEFKKDTGFNNDKFNTVYNECKSIIKKNDEDGEKEVYQYDVEDKIKLSELSIMYNRFIKYLKMSDYVFKFFIPELLIYIGSKMCANFELKKSNKLKTKQQEIITKAKKTIEEIQQDTSTSQERKHFLTAEENNKIEIANETIQTNELRITKLMSDVDVAKIDSEEEKKKIFSVMKILYNFFKNKSVDSVKESVNKAKISSPYSGVDALPPFINAVCTYYKNLNEYCYTHAEEIMKLGINSQILLSETIHTLLGIQKKLMRTIQHIREIIPADLQSDLSSYIQAFLTYSISADTIQNVKHAMSFQSLESLNSIFDILSISKFSPTDRASASSTQPVPPGQQPPPPGQQPPMLRQQPAQPGQQPAQPGQQSLPVIASSASASQIPTPGQQHQHGIPSSASTSQLNPSGRGNIFKKHSDRDRASSVVRNRRMRTGIDSVRGGMQGATPQGATKIKNKTPDDKIKDQIKYIAKKLIDLNKFIYITLLKVRNNSLLTVQEKELLNEILSRYFLHTLLAFSPLGISFNLPNRLRNNNYQPLIDSKTSQDFKIFLGINLQQIPSELRKDYKNLNNYDNYHLDCFKRFFQEYYGKGDSEVKFWKLLCKLLNIQDKSEQLKITSVLSDDAMVKYFKDDYDDMNIDSDED